VSQTITLSLGQSVLIAISHFRVLRQPTAAVFAKVGVFSGKKKATTLDPRSGMSDPDADWHGHKKGAKFFACTYNYNFVVLHLLL
jgi:hypothetical protein